ncbi:type VI secretion system baseplate subunit TssG [Aeoliella mucimassa]|uniref:Type VI secretion protein, VC_A0111 family n=1 Tax=Aeoliella mucimassa TaxID=2527972 RepID=A0A518AUF6_9BACT|nr:type VI secretion system baseplate subunit TssG [Aeoliella mucimassa]QDU58356.1 hypothetical protein Pan181_45900 [Aeoliella mucimassa]
MTISNSQTSPTKNANELEDLLSDQGHAFDFYQAISLLTKQETDGDVRIADEKPVKFVTSPSLAFPASAIQRIDIADSQAPPTVTVNFMGLTGPSGVLPRHYTEKVQEIERDGHGPARHAMRGWFDMFTSRFVWSMYRAWKKMRIDRSLPERQGPRPPRSTYTQALFGLIGLGGNAFRNRLHVTTTPGTSERTHTTSDDFINDWALLRHVSVLSRRRRSAAQIERVLSEHFQVSITVEQFTGQWLELDSASQTRLGCRNNNSQLGISAIVGSRVWDVQSKLRLRVGPLSQQQFDSFLPNTSPDGERRRFFMLCQLARLLLGPEFDFDVQLVLDHQQVPAMQLGSPTETSSFRLGWNTWLSASSKHSDRVDAIFPCIDSTSIESVCSSANVA